MLKLSAALLAVMLVGCSLTRSEEDPVQVRLNDLDARLTKLERIMSNQSLLDMAQHLDTVQADVRTLRGQVDELQNGSEAMRKQQRDLYADLDRRLTVRSAAVAPGGQTGASGTPAGSASGADQATYAQAFEALKNGNYGASIAGFKQYLATYPTGDLADNAQYWLGETYYVTRDYDNAAVAFRAVGERWPNSRKAPDALVKLGFTEFELKQYPEARATLTQVTKRFPDSDAAKLAADRLKRLPPDAQ
jgi:tol-pal system protein YbgF